MEFIIAKSGGFCHGVKKAVDTALSIQAENTYIYGEIIHNPEVVQQITDRGIVMVEDLNEVPCGATLIIRSHGVGKAVYELCNSRNVQIVDCTCEFVRRTQKIVREQHAQGKTIVIVGEKTHPEVVGTVLKKLPPEVSAEIRHAGIYVAGVGSTVYGLEKFYSKIFDMKINVSENGMMAVALGGGIALGDKDLIKKITLPV